MKIVTTLTDEQVQLLQENASIIGDNYFLPYWFKRIEGNKFELLSLGNLPPEMSREIEEMRKQVKRDSLIASLNETTPNGYAECCRKYPFTKQESHDNNNKI